MTKHTPGPDLLDALRNLYRWILRDKGISNDEVKDNDSYLGQAKQAIAKAEGAK